MVGWHDKIEKRTLSYVKGQKMRLKLSEMRIEGNLIQSMENIYFVPYD